MNKPYLYFTFEQKPMLFAEPQEVITAYQIKDVLPAIDRIEKRIAEGWYAAGYIAYEAAPAFDTSFRVAQQNEMPLLWFGIFSAPFTQEWSKRERDFSYSPWQPDVSEEQYQTAIAQIKEWIAQGDTYQVNYTMRFKTDFTGDTWAYYQKLKRAQQSMYSVYANLGRYHLLSTSPELFFRFDDQLVTTRPMKGTIKRGLSYEEDQQRLQQLKQSEKDQAENLMIVDLLRNDLSRIAQPYTVQVPELFTTEAYPTVWQLTSTVTAQKKPKTSWRDLLQALFPCGSVTGAPKIKTMELIQKLETSAREVYCGTIGYLTPHGSGVFNVPIRTVWVDTVKNKAIYGVGGGITWDSTVQGEYQEAWTKAACLVEESPTFCLLESILLQEGQYHLLSEHLQRIKQSAQYFQFNFDMEQVRAALQTLAEQKAVGRWKVRLLYNKQQKINLEAEELMLLPPSCVVTWAKQPIDRHHRFLYHKTTYRQIYDKMKIEQSQAFDVLLWNDKEECTEFTVGNLVVEIDGIKWTPPIDSGLLAGTFRQHLLERGEILVRVLHKKEIEGATRIWLINSVRGWVEVDLVTTLKQ